MIRTGYMITEWASSSLQFKAAQKKDGGFQDISNKIVLIFWSGNGGYDLLNKLKTY